MKGHNANGIFDIAMLTEFIHKTNTQSANCGCAMDILTFDNKGLPISYLQKGGDILTETFAKNLFNNNNWANVWPSSTPLEM